MQWQKHLHKIISEHCQEVIRKGCSCHPERSHPNLKKEKKRKEKKEVWQEAHEQKLQEHDQTRKEIDSRNSSHNSLTPPPHNILEKQQDATRTKQKKKKQRIKERERKANAKQKKK